MSVIVSNLTKIYGTQRSVDNISFRAEPGQITGFLGPNGAGKSTTMKIATGYIAANEGHVSVCGLDVKENPMAVKTKIGYLPEHNPLYLDMYVKEYLQFIANIYKLDKTADRIRNVIEKVGLEREQTKKIGALSKGYRQRVGLAQAIIHNPEVLILDEPLTGLDPNQMVEIRNVIKELGRDKTIIFSTHIMQEVQHLCDKVVIINKGKIVADTKLDYLQGKNGAYRTLLVSFASVVSQDQISQLENIYRTETIDQQTYRLTHEAHIDLRPQLMRWATDNALIINTLQNEEKSLEEIFRQLTSN